MRAAVCRAYGGPNVVEVCDVETPVPKDNEVLIRVHASTVSSGDARVRSSNFPSGFTLPARLIFGITRLRRPILGTELAGTVEAVGARVTRFKRGDRVFAFSGGKFGCHAELKTFAEDGAIASMPEGFGFAEAAAISFGGTTALHFLRGPGKLEPGERVLVYGASGSVGSAAVQLAKHFGAHVTGVCSAANGGLVRSLGAESVIDHRTQDFARLNERWDIILDTIGNALYHRSRNSLNAKGRLLIVAAGLGELMRAPFQSMSSGLTVSGGAAPERAEDLTELKRLCEARVFKPVIDSCFPLAHIAAAHARVDLGRKKGNVIVEMSDQ